MARRSGVAWRCQPTNVLRDGTGHGTSRRGDARVTEGYLILATFLAVSLNQSNRLIRSLGTLLAALALAMIAWSIILANLDGTFAAVPAGARRTDQLRSLVLNAQAAVASVAAVFLLWAAWVQARRRVDAPLPLRNTPAAFGRVSRYAHWIIGTLILVLIPMGLFTSVLPVDHPERGAFVATHQALGTIVLILVALRLLWLRRSPAPPLRTDLRRWEQRLAQATHVGLYGLILGFPVTGLLMTSFRGEAPDVYGWSLGGVIAPDPQLASVAAALHNLVLPAAFYLVVFAHLGAVAKHHFIERRRDDVRRMLR